MKVKTDHFYLRAFQRGILKKDVSNLLKKGELIAQENGCFKLVHENLVAIIGPKGELITIYYDEEGQNLTQSQEIGKDQSWQSSQKIQSQLSSLKNKQDSSEKIQNKEDSGINKESNSGEHEISYETYINLNKKK